MFGAILVGFFSLMVAGGRIVNQENKVRSAAHAAARAASLRGTFSDAVAEAEAVASDNLDEAGLVCTEQAITVTSGAGDFVPGGFVTVEVSCTAQVAGVLDLSDNVYTYPATEVIDEYRGNRDQAPTRSADRAWVGLGHDGRARLRHLRCPGPGGPWRSLPRGAVRGPGHRRQRGQGRGPGGRSRAVARLGPPRDRPRPGRAEISQFLGASGLVDRIDGWTTVAPTGPDPDLTVAVQVTLTPRRFFFPEHTVTAVGSATALDGVSAP